MKNKSFLVDVVQSLVCEKAPSQSLGTEFWLDVATILANPSSLRGLLLLLVMNAKISPSLFC